MHSCHVRLRSFLGLLHMEVFHQRLEQEHGASVITTAPTVPYALDLFGGARLEIENPSQVCCGHCHTKLLLYCGF